MNIEAHNTESAMPGAIAPAKQQERVVFHVPIFPGWYDSWLDQELDMEIERDAEYIAEERNSHFFADEQDSNYNMPDPLKLDACEVSDLYFEKRDWSDYRATRTREYVETLATVLEDESWPGARLPLSNAESWGACLVALARSLEFESMTSPRFYNFETDRLFCYGDLRAFRVMLRLALNDDNRAAWQEFLKARHSSRSGFISHYPYMIEAWPDSVKEFDHNELASLFLFALQQCEAFRDGDSLDSQIMHVMIGDRENTAFYSEQLGDSEFAEKRGEKLIEWLDTDLIDYEDDLHESPALKWLAGNPSGAIVEAARDHDADMINRALEAIEQSLKGVTLRCDKTPDMFGSDGAASG